MFICIVRLNLLVDIGVSETLATTESELNKFEYLEPLLKKNRLMPNNIANTNPIFDLPNDLNIFYKTNCLYNITLYKGNKYNEN